MAEDYALYRYFDGDDKLLYLGKTWRLAFRETSHIARSKWMQFAVRSTIERYPTAETLKDAERTAIKAEHPLFNLQHNDDAEARERLRAYLEQIHRLDLMPQPRGRKAVPWRCPERVSIGRALDEPPRIAATAGTMTTRIVIPAYEYWNTQ